MTKMIYSEYICPCGHGLVVKQAVQVDCFEPRILSVQVKCDNCYLTYLHLRRDCKRIPHGEFVRCYYRGSKPSESLDADIHLCYSYLDAGNWPSAERIARRLGIMARTAREKVINLDELAEYEMPVFATLAEVVNSSGLSRSEVISAAESGTLKVVARTVEGKPLFDASAVEGLKASKIERLRAELAKLQGNGSLPEKVPA